MGKQLHSVNSPTGEDALLNVHLVRPKSSFTSCGNVQGIIDHCCVLLEVEWGENCLQHQVERLVPVYHKKNTRSTAFPQGKIRILGKL